MRFKLGLACLVIAATACSSSSSGSPEGGIGADGASEGAATADGPPTSSEDANATSDADDAATACNTLPNAAQAVPVVQVASDPPAAQGGTPADGIYTLTDYTVYTGPGGPAGPTKTDRITIQIEGGTIQVTKDSSPQTSTYELTTNGTSYVAAAVCPPGSGNLAGSYTATPTTFVASIAASSSDGGAPWFVESFTKQ